MDTNQVSLTRTMLNISTPASQGLNFSQGEIVKGVVQEVKPDGTVMITIKGQTIEALTEVQVQPGQQLYLKVDDFRDGKTFLKVVTPEGLAVMENANLSANLLDMGIAAKGDNIAMARKLLDYNLPVTVSNLSEMAKGVKLLGASTPRSLEIVAFVMSRNLPVNAATLKALEQYTLPGSNIAKLVESVLQSLRQLGQTGEMASLVNIDDPVNNTGSTITASSAATTADTADAGTTNPGPANRASSAGISEAVASQVSTPSSASSAVSGTEEGKTNSSAGPAQTGVNIAGTVPEQGTAEAKASQASPGQGGTVNIVSEQNQPTVSDGQRLSAQPAAPAPSGTPVPDTGKPAAMPSVTISTEMPETVVVQPGNSLPVPDTEAVAPGLPTTVAVDDGPEGEPVLPFNTPGSTSTSADEAAVTNRPATTPESGGNKAAATLPANQPAPSGTAVDSAKANQSSTINTTALADGDEAKVTGTQTGPASPPADAREIANVVGRQSIAEAGENRQAGKIIADVAAGLLKVADSTEANTAKTSSASAQTTGGSSKIGDQLNLLRSLIEWMQVDGREPSQEISHRLERAVASDKDIIRGLNLLEDAIKSENTQTRSPAVHELLRRIDSLENELSGQKMFNYMSRTSVDNQFNFYYFSIPVKVGGEVHQCQLRFNKDGRRDLRNVDNLSFVVSLDTGKMGLVLFHVNWQRNHSLALQGVVESSGVADYLTSNIDGLVGKLKDLGYSVQNLGIKVSQEQIDESLKIRVEEAPMSIRPLGIDITV